MKSKTAIIKLMQTLHYFDQNLVLDVNKVSNLTEKDINQAKRLQRESILVNKYITIHIYKQLNDKTLLMPQEFKFLITKGTEPIILIKRLNKNFPTMPLEEFETMEKVYDEMNGK